MKKSAAAKDMQNSPGALYLVSLGCPKNLVDTETVAGALLSGGMEFAFEPEDATTYFINTCAFLQSARDEAASAIAGGVEWKKTHPQGKLIVGGCLAVHAEAQEYKKRFPEVDLWAGPKELEKIAPQPECCPGVPVRLSLTFPHISYLRIADGCDNRCAYCLIPKLRGPKVCRPMAAVLAEAELLVKNGTKELILIAQDTSAYGDGRKETLAALLRKLQEIPGNFRIRILYTHPAHYTDELIDAVAECSKVIPYLDIPLQHISDHILKAMNRHTDGKTIRDLVTKLRNRIPGLALRTTLITGFPGETEEDFQELLEFCAEARFERLGVFPFSPEPGTMAAKMAPQVPADAAVERASEILKRQHQRIARINAGLIGKTMTVLVDDVTGEYPVARTYADAPEIDQFVRLAPSKKWRPGEFFQVRITGTLKGGDLTAEAARSPKRK